MSETIRKRLPSKRRSESIDLSVGGHALHLQIAPADGPPQELFIDLGKEGSSLRPWADSVARLVSLALQSGIPLGSVAKALLGDRGDPSGRVVGHNKVTWALSVPDAIGRVLAVDHLGREDLAISPPEAL